MVGHIPLEDVIGVRVPDWQLGKIKTHQTEKLRCVLILTQRQ